MTNVANTSNEAFIALANTSIDARIAYEADKNAANESIKAKLNSIRNTMTNDVIVSVMTACSYDVASINASVRVTAKRNVYSIEKDANIARFIAAAASLNHYTLAIFKTAIALEANEMLLSHKSAQAACSQSLKHSDSKVEKLIKTTRYAKNVDASTASTQSSSSINALEAMNVLTTERNAANEVCYKLNRTSAAFIAIDAKLNAAVAA